MGCFSLPLGHTPEDVFDDERDSQLLQRIIRNPFSTQEQVQSARLSLGIPFAFQVSGALPIGIRPRSRINIRSSGSPLGRLPEFLKSFGYILKNYEHLISDSVLFKAIQYLCQNALHSLRDRLEHKINMALLYVKGATDEMTSEMAREYLTEAINNPDVDEAMKNVAHRVMSKLV